MPSLYARRVALAIIAVSALAGCGSSSTSPSTSSSPRTTSHRTNQAVASTGGRSALINVCSLLDIQQVDVVLGAGSAPWTPTAELPNGYFSGTLLHDEVEKNMVHRADPGITLSAYATCSWQNHTVLLPNTTASDPGHPEAGFVLTTWSAPVSEALYFKALYKTNNGGFEERIPGVGQWAAYDHDTNEIVAGVGDSVIDISNDYGAPQEYSPRLQQQYTQLMKIIVSKLE